MAKKYEESHPWLDFDLDKRKFPPQFWVDLGECVSKCDHIQRTALPDHLRKELYRIYFTKAAMATTAIEGNTLSEEQVRNIIADGEQSFLDKHQPDMEIEVRNVATLYNKIVNDAQENALPPLSPKMLCDFQRQTLRDLPIAGNIGSLRQRGVVVGGYRGAPEQDCAYLLERLCDWLASGTIFAELDDTISKKATAIIRAALAHLYIAWIHPFDDGNGRTARMAEFYVLTAAGLPAPAAHLSANHCNQLRPNYYRQLANASADKSPVEFVRFIVRGLRDGLREQLAHIYKEHERLVWRDVCEQTITGSKEARKRRIDVASLLLEQESATTAKRLMDDPRIRVLYAAKKSAPILLQADLEHLIRLKIAGKDGNGYRANKALITRMKPLTSDNPIQT